jgi:hypothetical protein
MSEVIPEDEDRGGDGVIEGAVGATSAAGADVEDGDEGGNGPDDGGPGSLNM